MSAVTNEKAVTCHMLYVDIYIDTKLQEFNHSAMYSLNLTATQFYYQVFSTYNR